MQVLEEEITKFSIIIRSNAQVTAPNEFQTYIINNYDSPKLENSNILILGGVHGTEMGKIETDSQRINEPKIKPLFHNCIQYIEKRIGQEAFRVEPNERHDIEDKGAMMTLGRNKLEDRVIELKYKDIEDLKIGGWKLHKEFEAQYLY